MPKQTTKRFLLPDGNTVRHAVAEAIALQIVFADGQNKTFDPSELPSEIVKCLAFHGLSQKLGDAGAGKSTEEFLERVDTIWESLKENRWVEKAEGAIRTSLLAEAISEVKPDKYPTAADAAKMLAELDMKTQEGKDRRKQIESIPQVVVVLERKKAERAAERAEKAKKAAKGADTTTLDVL